MTGPKRTLGSILLRWLALALLAALTLFPSSPPLGAQAQRYAKAQREDLQTIEWPAYGRDPGGSRYSPAAQVTRENASQLRVAWIYRTGDLLRGGNGTRFEAAPLLVDGTLYISTPFGRVIALDPETGRERWTFDPGVDLEGDYGDFANRGVATWLDSKAPRGKPCRRRIFVAPIDARLIALDAASGKPCADFGQGGQVDLNRDLVNAPAWKGEYQVTSPPTVVGNLVIVGSAIADNQRADAPSGVVRAFDARTSKLRWSWDPIPREPSDKAHETWKSPSGRRTGAANAWSVFSADPARDLVFVPVGSAAPDFYGGERLGQNLYANSVVALRASTGKMVWHFQAVHHDLWDYDVPAQPVLATLRREGREIPVVVQPTKMGFLFILHRYTGKPVFPVEERPVPESDVPGETAWPTQPFPTRPPPLVPQRLTTDDAWGVTAGTREWCRERIAALRSEGVFTPPSVRGTVIFPGNIGGMNWSSVSVDPARNLVVAPTNRLAFSVKLVPRAEYAAARRASAGAEVSPQAGTPYAMVRDLLVHGLAEGRMVPCSPPPWGALTAVDLSTGEVRWEVPLGYMPWLADHPESRSWGSINLGGALVTGGGLVFIAGTYDQHLRAFDIETGKELWSAELPAAGNATPVSYQVNGRQYIVIAAGGHGRLQTKMGDHVVAFALPASEEERKTEPALASWSGRYVGRVIGGRHRYDAVLELRQKADNSVTGTLEMSEPTITGTLSGTAEGKRLPFTIDFTFPARNCTGKLIGEAEWVNDGTLVVGEFRVTGACTEGREELGNLSLRPASGEPPPAVK
jgi:quinoprotein glucose dehydrogenase